MTLPTDVLNGFRDYLGLYHYDETGRVVELTSDNTSAQTKILIEAVNADPPTPDSPVGRGRIVQLPSARLLTPQLVLPQAQSLHGVKGSTFLTLASDEVIDDQGGGVGAYITIDSDFRVEDGIAGQGVIQDLDIDATNTKHAHSGSPTTIHGLYAPSRDIDPPNPPDPANLHTMRNVGVYNAKSNGIHFDVGNDKLVGDRLRSEGALGVGMYLAGGDVKLRAIGSVAESSALVITGSAVEIDQFDLWRSAFDQEPTLVIRGASNGCVIKSGTVEGKTYFRGKNARTEAAERFLNCRAQFAFVHFKFDPEQVHDVNNCYLEVESADLLELISCKFGGDDDQEVADPYDYLIMITNKDSSDNDGVVKISGGSGMLRYLGRDNGANPRMRIDAALHICNMPKLLMFDWGPLGTIEMAPPWVADPSNHARTHLRCDGTPYNSDDQPFAYLNYKAHVVGSSTDYGTLQDSTSFTMPRYPVLSSNCVPALRAIP